MLGQSRKVQNRSWWADFIFDRLAHIAVTSTLIGIVFTVKLLSRRPDGWLGIFYNRIPNSIWAALFIAAAVIPILFFGYLQGLYIDEERSRQAETLGVKPSRDRS